MNKNIEIITVSKVEIEEEIKCIEGVFGTIRLYLLDRVLIFLLIP